MTEIPHATSLEPWELKIVEGAMLQAQATKGILHTTFAERVRALSVLDAGLAGSTQALEALRADLHRAVDESHSAAVELVGEWWA